MRSDNLYQLPEGLPVPVDDGACAHLPGMRVPSLSLTSTANREVNLASLPGRIIVYCYPRTGSPHADPPPGWDEVPGARGCTPQSCAFRDHYREIRAFGAEVFGLSTQNTDYQQEVVERLHLPFEILSDAGLKLTTALRLPTFTIAGMTLLRRLTLVLRDGVVEYVFYPVFPPDANADEVLRWLSVREGGSRTLRTDSIR
jgi:peroxiredoxin